jgi:hypothetical protein
MRQSLAPDRLDACQAPPSNNSFEADTQRHCATSRAGAYASRRMPLRASQLRRWGVALRMHRSGPLIWLDLSRDKASLATVLDPLVVVATVTYARDL